jgi:hypothetical protein
MLLLITIAMKLAPRGWFDSRPCAGVNEAKNTSASKEGLEGTHSLATPALVGHCVCNMSFGKLMLLRHARPARPRTQKSRCVGIVIGAALEQLEKQFAEV